MYIDSIFTKRNSIDAILIKCNEIFQGKLKYNIYVGLSVQRNIYMCVCLHKLLCSKSFKNDNKVEKGKKKKQKGENKNNFYNKIYLLNHTISSNAFLSCFASLKITIEKHEIAPRIFSTTL